MPEEVEIVTTDEGGEATIAAMDENQYTEIGRKTYNFVRRCMRDPVLRERIQARAAEIRAARSAKSEEIATPV